MNNSSNFKKTAKEDDGGDENVTINHVNNSDIIECNDSKLSNRRQEGNNNINNNGNSFDCEDELRQLCLRHTLVPIDDDDEIDPELREIELSRDDTLVIYDDDEDDRSGDGSQSGYDRDFNISINTAFSAFRRLNNDDEGDRVVQPGVESIGGNDSEAATASSRRRRRRRDTSNNSNGSENLPQAYPLQIPTVPDTQNNITVQFHQEDQSDLITVPGTVVNTNHASNEQAGATRLQRNDLREDEASLLKEQQQKKRLVIASISLYFIAVILFIARTNIINKRQDNINMDAAQEQKEKNDEINEEPLSVDEFVATLNNETDASHNPTVILDETDISTTKPYVCYKDPMVILQIEWDLYEKGTDDPSIERTYHICSNSTLNVFFFNQKFVNFDYSTGDVYPLTFFRSNIHVKCGPDGAFENNCTFSGGFMQIIPVQRPFFVSYNLNSKTENITIEGFRFTGVYGGGSNIFNRNRDTSFFIKNCLFEDNYGVVSNIYMTRFDSNFSSMTIENCTFRNNAYKINPDTHTESPQMEGRYHRPVQNIGTIVSNPAIHTLKSDDAFVEVNISNSIFSNNTFILEKHGFDYMTGSIINIQPPVTYVNVTDSRFTNNTNFLAGMILLGMWEDGETHQHYSNLSFSEDNHAAASDLYGITCFPDYKNISHRCQTIYSYEVGG